ncbi:MAG TPA: peptidoglycan DD-metalloendopeptidase family protein [Longimicrobiales bacterium]
MGAATGPTYDYEAPVRVMVVPQALQLAPGEARALSVEVRAASGDLLPAAVQWSVDSAGIAEVSPTGEVRGLRAGTARVIARVGVVSGTADVTVLPRAPANVTITPDSIEIFTPESRMLSALVHDTAGNPLPVPVQWTSSDASVVVVDTAGRISGVAPGVATIEARAGDARAVAVVRVLAPLGLEFPVLGVLNHDFYYTNHVDHQPSYGGRLDFHCGPRTYDGHAGTDIVLRNFALMDQGVPVVAAAPGRVIAVRDGLPDRNKSWDVGGGLGNYVVIEHRDGFRTYYGHLQRNSIRVTPGQVVEAGERLGNVGSSGMSDMPHLHIELRRNGEVIDPFAGPCGATFSHWAAPHPYDDSLRLIDSGITAVPLNLDVVKDPPPQVSVFRTSDRRVYVWIQLLNVRAGTTTRFELYRPNGTLFRTFSQHHHSFFSMSWWWFWHDIPGYLTQPGTWRVVVWNDDSRLGEVTFDLVTDTYAEQAVAAAPGPAGPSGGAAGNGFGSPHPHAVR